jgi:replicative DNA helicase
MTDESPELPYSLGPEKSVLSSMLKDAAMIVRAQSEGIGEAHFHIPAHRQLFREIRTRHAAGREIELVMLVEDMQRDGTLESVGGPAGITEVYTYAPNGAHFASHCDALRRDHARRQSIADARRLIDDAPTMEPAELLGALSRALEGTTKALQSGPRAIDAKEAIKRLSAQLKALESADAAIPGLPTGLTPIDLVTGGMWPFELWVVAADTSCGKSVIMLQAALEVLREGKRVLIVSLEMNAATIAGRMISNLKSVPNDVWRKPKMAKEYHLKQAMIGMDAFAQYRLTIDDEGGRTVDDVLALAQTEIDRHGSLDLIVVDYLQRIVPRHQKGRSREQEVADISTALKSIAMKLKVPIFTASQLTKDGKGGFRLRDSSAIGFDADVVLRVTEDGIVGDKVRNGERDQSFPLVLNGEFQRFERKQAETHQQEFR